MAKDYFDISPLISSRMAVFPGDRAFSRKVVLNLAHGDSLSLSEIFTTVHLGAHADAPNHYHREGLGIDQRSLIPYLGRCQVVRVQKKRGERILPSDLPKGWKAQAPRVLFHTGSFPDPDQWNGDFNSLSPALIHFLADQGVQLIGIDTPSVDPAEDKALESHQAIYQRDLAILEGVMLNEVPDGVYTLVALPLRIEGADASPVRAILVKKASLFSV